MEKLLRLSMSSTHSIWRAGFIRRNKRMIAAAKFALFSISTTSGQIPFKRSRRLRIASTLTSSALAKRSSGTPRSRARKIM
jgi:hypothetical protein